MGIGPPSSSYLPMSPDSAADDGNSPLPSTSGASETFTDGQDDRPAAKRGRRSRPKVKTGCTNCK